MPKGAIGIVDARKSTLWQVLLCVVHTVCMNLADIPPPLIVLAALLFLSVMMGSFKDHIPPAACFLVVLI